MSKDKADRENKENKEREVKHETGVNIKQPPAAPTDTPTPTLEEYVNRSWMLSNPNLPGINHVKQERINNYVNKIIQSQTLDVSKVQLLIKDNGDDIRVTVYNDGAIYTQINYSQIP